MFEISTVSILLITYLNRIGKKKEKKNSSNNKEVSSFAPIKKYLPISDVKREAKKVMYMFVTMHNIFKQGLYAMH